jgi:hypothetical protein
MTMAQFSFKQTGQAALLASIAAAFPVVAHGAPAARVDFAVGDVTAVNAAGQARPLAKGAQIEPGETIATNNGRAQLRFTDGAYMSLQPQSEFRIDQYLYEGKEDGNEKTFLSLVKGGLRTITGFVGRTNKRNYQVTTSVATIGIRGTEYTIQYGNSISGTVGEGEIEVCNGAGCLNVTDGETYYVENQDVKPQLSNKGTDLPPAPPENPPSDFKDGENVDESGTPCAIGGACGNLLTVTGTVNVAYTSQNVLLDTQAKVSSGQLQSFDFFSSPATMSAPFTNVGGDNIIAWGTAADCSGGECGGITNYVVGLPADNIGNLSNVTGTYSLLGGTPILDGATVVGTLNSASMTVNFFSGSAFGSLDMNITLGGTARDVNDMFVSGGSGSFFFAGSEDSLSTFVSGSGFFSGTNAVRA